jgi:hypothetical protein
VKKINLTRIGTILFVLNIISCASPPTETVSYLRQPSTGGEVAVAKTLETMITAYNNRDIAKHLSCFAADARIDSNIAGRVISKVEYREILEKRSKTTALQLRNTRFTDISPIKYRVDAVLAGRNSRNITYELVPFKGRWVILVQSYK